MGRLVVTKKRNRIIHADLCCEEFTAGFSLLLQLFDLNACFSLLFVCLCIYCVRACVRACFSKFFFSLFTFFVFFDISRTLLILRRKITKVIRGSFLFWAKRIAFVMPFASSLYACELIYGKPLCAAIFGFSFDRSLSP